MRTRTAQPPRHAQHDACCECDPDTLESPWKAELCTVLHARNEADLRQQLEAFVETNMSDVLRVLGRVKRIARLKWDDDGLALSYFGQALLRMVNQRWRAKDGPGTRPVFNYSSSVPMILEAETRSCIRDDRRQGLLNGTAGVPGGGAQDRKAAHIAKSRQLFEIEHGFSASDDELVAFHNDRMRATRKDAARQATLITGDDLRPGRAVPLDEVSEEVDGRLGVAASSDSGALNWADRIVAVIGRCSQLDREREDGRTRRLKREPVLSADVARAYFAHHAIGEFPTRRELVERLDLTEPATRRELSVRLREVLDVARDLFADYRSAP